MHRIVIIVIIALLTLCYFIISHATLVLYYHASMLKHYKPPQYHVHLGSHMHDISDVEVYPPLPHLLTSGVFIYLQYSSRQPQPFN